MTNPAHIRQILGDALGYLYPAALRVATRFGIADHLADGPKTPQELGRLTGVDAAHLGRVMRFLATREMFREDEAGAFHLTAAAQLLRTDGPISLRSIIMLFTDEMYWRPAGQLDEIVHKGETAFSDIFDRPFFDYLPAHAEQEELFSAALADLSMFEQGAIAAAYEFPANGTVMDVAGGRGGFLHAILKANPGLKGILFERPSVLKNHRLADAAIAGRWDLVEGDFFAAVPTGADIYLLKRIVHDKSDEECVGILRSIRKAMTPDSRLLIVDAVIPAEGEMPIGMILADVLMMTVWDGRERTESEFERLLAEVDLKLNRILPTPTALSIVEAVAA